jgi:hypothetical protein
MLEIADVTDTAADFQLAVMSLRQADIRSDLNVTEIPSPDKLAKHSLALAAHVGAESHAAQADAGTGTLVRMSS